MLRRRRLGRILSERSKDFRLIAAHRRQGAARRLARRGRRSVRHGRHGQRLLGQHVRVKRAARAPVCSCALGVSGKGALSAPVSAADVDAIKALETLVTELDGRLTERLGDLNPGVGRFRSVVREKVRALPAPAPPPPPKVEEAPPPAATTNGTNGTAVAAPLPVQAGRWPRRRRRSRRLRRPGGRIARGAARQVRAVARGARRPGARGACTAPGDPWVIRLLRTAAWMTYDTPPEVTAGRRTRARPPQELSSLTEWSTRRIGQGSSKSRGVRRPIRVLVRPALLLRDGTRRLNQTAARDAIGAK